MKKLHYSIVINAPREQVWHAMLDEKPYREWTQAFNPGSYYKGDWSKGSKMLFLGPDPKTGEEGGMVSRVAERKPYEFISIEHLGIVKDGKEDTTSEEAKKWTPVFENYTLKDKDGSIEVLVEMDSMEEYADMFDAMWPEALERLKDVAEGREPKYLVVSAMVDAPIEKVWDCWRSPEHIVKWAFASDDWEAPSAENDLRVGGKFTTRMAAKDKSAAFDFSGTYTAVKEHELIKYTMDDGRHAKIEFNNTPEGVFVKESFEPETENTREMQTSGWQAILNNFKKYVERNA